MKKGHNYSHVLLTSTRLEEESIFSATHNEMNSSAIISIVFSSWKTTLDSELIMDNDNYGIFVSSNLSFGGAVRVVNNNISYVEALTFVSSTVWFNSSLEVVGNRVKESGGIQALISNLYMTGRVSFADNYASNGGALTLISSVLYISPTPLLTLLGTMRNG